MLTVIRIDFVKLITFYYCLLCLRQSLLSVDAYLSPNYFCADLNPQSYVNINQLMGMWYGIEILDHINSHEPDQVQYHFSAVCPILHLSEELLNPSDGYNAGALLIPTSSASSVRYTLNENYHPSWSHKYSQMRAHHRSTHQQRHLRIWWDEAGTATEYRLKYNMSRPGLWYITGTSPSGTASSMPQPTVQQPPRNHPQQFLGSVQVLKAVGNHLVLLFCRALPQKHQLQTVLLARQRTLDYFDVHGVHSLLRRKGLNVNHVRDVCHNPDGRYSAAAAATAASQSDKHQNYAIQLIVPCIFILIILLLL